MVSCDAMGSALDFWPNLHWPFKKGFSAVSAVVFVWPQIHILKAYHLSDKC